MNPEITATMALMALVILAWVDLRRKLQTMSETTQSAHDAIAGIKTTLDAEIAANTKFRADVVTALGRLSGNLTAEDQAIVDGLKAAATADTTATEAADAALPAG